MPTPSPTPERDATKYHAAESPVPIAQPSVKATDITPTSSAQKSSGIAEVKSKLVEALERRIRQLEAQLEAIQKTLCETAAALAKKTKKKVQTHTFYEAPFLISFPDDSNSYPRSPKTAHGELPTHFYRCLHEESATITPYMTKACWPSQHPELKKGAAFQSLGEFLAVRDLTLERVMRHFAWFQKRPSTSFISVFDSYMKCEIRCNHHYRISLRAVRRISMAMITTDGLIPAFFETTQIIPSSPEVAPTAEEIMSITPDSVAEPSASEAAVGEADKTSASYDGADDTNIEIEAENPAIAEQRIRVKIPIWVRDTARPADGSTITLQQFEKSGADMWISVWENREHGLEIPQGSKGQDEEWLACGFIPTSAIVYVWPYDGNKVHRKEGAEVIVSSDNQDWHYDWLHRIWRSAWEMATIRKELRQEPPKRRTASDSDQIADPASKRFKSSTTSQTT